VGPGSNVGLRIETGANSDVALLAVDAGLYALNNENKLDREQVFEDMDKYDTSCSVEEFTPEGLFYAMGLTAITDLTFSIKDRSDVNCDENVPTTASPTVETDSPGQKNSVNTKINNKCCRLFGRAVRKSIIRSSSQPSDLQVEDLKTKCDEVLNHLTTNADALQGSTVPFECEPTPKCLEEFLESCITSFRARASYQSGSQDILGQLIVSRRSYFPHVWLVDEVISMESNTGITKTVTVPHSITNWVLHSLSLSQTGFGVAKPTNLRVYKSLFVECKIPFSVRRLEQITFICTAFNYGYTTTVLISLINIPESICTRAGLGATTISQRLTLYQNAPVSVVFTIVPLDVGSHKLTVRMVNMNGVADDVVIEIRVEPEGLTVLQCFNAELDPQALISDLGQKCGSRSDQTGPCYKDSSCSVPTLASLTFSECCDLRNTPRNAAWGYKCTPCSKTTETRVSTSNEKKQINHFDLVPPQNAVYGSVKGFLTITGRYLQGEGIRSTRTKHLLGIPMGTRESSVFTLGILAINMKYLTYLGLNGSTEFAEVMSSASEAYMDVTSLLGSNNGFKQELNGTESISLTAIALMILAESSDNIYIDKELLEKSSEFLVSFLTKICPFDDLKAHMALTSPALSAYVLLSFLTIQRHHLVSQIGNYNCCIGESLEKEFNSGNIKDEYTTALVYYALSLSCHPTVGICPTCKPSLLDALDNQLCRSVHIDGGKRYWLGGSKTVTPRAITITSYVLCAQMARGNIPVARTIARWLNVVRNPRGGVTATEENYWSLKCLAQFSKFTDQRRSLDVTVSLVQSNFKRVFRIDYSNSHVVQSTAIPVNELLKVSTKGDGLGFLKACVTYNTADTDNEKCHFDLSITNKAVLNMHLRVCIRQKVAGSSNPVTVEVEIPTGYSACDRDETTGNPHCLYEILENHGSSLGLSSYEIAGKSVFLYFRQIPWNRDVCIEFMIIQEFSVKHLSPVAVRAHPTNDPESQCTAFYTIDGSKPTYDVLGCKDPATNPVCICAAGRCPKIEEKIARRRCNACKYHDYVFKIIVASITKKGTWLKIQVTIVKIVKGGRHNVREGTVAIFWMKEICKISAPFAVGSAYHVMGKEDTKYVLDHTAHIETWPDNIWKPDMKCVERKAKDCAENKCKKFDSRRNRYKVCYSKHFPTCKAEKKGSCHSGFGSYISDMATGQVCDRPDVC
jgi:hypothetical protein